MALSTPTIKQIKDNIINDIETQTGQTIPVLSKFMLNIIALALSGVWIILYKYGTDAGKQRFPQTANETYLSIIGALSGITRQSAVTFIGVCQCTGINDSGFITASTQLINTASGNIYLVKENTLISTGLFSVNVQASGSGTEYNLSVNEVLTFVSPLANVNNTGTITAITTLGEDQEDIEDYRTRVIESYKRKPQGGAAVDYVSWGIEPAAILNIYPYANSTLPGKVDLYIESAVSTDGIPTTAELALVQSYVDYDPTTDLSARRPLTAEINYLPITRTQYDVQIIGLTPDNADNRSACLTALTAYFVDKEPYIPGVSLNRNDTLNNALASAAVASALESSSGYFSNLKIFKAGDEIFSDIMGRGQKAKLGTLTYV